MENNSMLEAKEAVRRVMCKAYERDLVAIENAKTIGEVVAIHNELLEVLQIGVRCGALDLFDVEDKDMIESANERATLKLDKIEKTMRMNALESLKSITKNHISESRGRH